MAVDGTSAPPPASDQSGFSVARVVKLLTHPNTVDQRERHISEIKRLGKVYAFDQSLSMRVGSSTKHRRPSVPGRH